MSLRRRLTWTILLSLIFVAAGVITLYAVAASTRHNRSSSGTRKISFQVGEISASNLDVSPDGNLIAFDVLGQLYVVSAQGGTASPMLQHDWAVDSNPRFSPTGDELAFISDRGGERGVWLFDLRSEQVRPLHSGAEEGHSHSYWEAVGYRDLDGWPAGGRLSWAPSGSGILVGERDSDSRVKVIATDGSGFKWLIPPGGPREQISGAVLSPEGRFAFFSSLRSGRHSIFRLDLESGDRVAFSDTEAPYDEFTPELSRDGQWLAYGRFEGGVTQLRIRNLVTGSDRALIRLTTDEPSRGSFDSGLPSYSFMPDGRRIVIWSGGQLRWVDVQDGRSANIPLRVNVRRVVNAPLQANFPLEDGPVRVRAQRWASLSADRSSLVFAAAGELWRRELPDGLPMLATSTSDSVETMPSLSPDGTRVAFISFGWDRSGVTTPGRLRIMDLRTGEIEALLEDGSGFAVPRWSPDGKRLAVVRAARGDMLTLEIGWFDMSSNQVPVYHSVIQVPLSVARPIGYTSVYEINGDLIPYAEHLENIAWTSDNSHLIIPYVEEFTGVIEGGGYEGRLTIRLVPIRGGRHTVLATADRKFISEAIPSPDLRHIAIVGQDHQIYVGELTRANGRPVTLTIDDDSTPRVTEAGSVRAHWQDSSRLIFSLMDQVLSYEIGNKNAEVVARTELLLRRNEGRGRFAIRNVRLITVSSARGAGPIIENGTIVVYNRRIESIGSTDQISIPVGTRVFDGTGLTIMPGIVDVHYHGVSIWKEVPIRAIAYGVTTAFEPGGADPRDGAADWQSMREVGFLTSPRFLFDNGATRSIVVRPNSRISPLNQIRLAVRLKRILGAGPCLKNSADQDRVFVRMLVQVAQEEGMCIIGHTSDVAMGLAYVIDGIHPHHWGAFPNPSFEDISRFLALSGAIWSPHFTSSSSTSHRQFAYMRFHEQEMRQNLSVSVFEKFERFYDGDRYKQIYDLVPFVPVEQMWAVHAADSAERLMAAGTRLAISGDIALLTNSRAEMRLFERVGMRQDEIIRSVTLSNAEELGIDDDVGSLEPGKIADFIILTRNPLESILNSLYIKWTVMDGAIYDAESARRLN